MCRPVQDMSFCEVSGKAEVVVIGDISCIISSKGHNDTAYRNYLKIKTGSTMAHHCL